MYQPQGFKKFGGAPQAGAPKKFKSPEEKMADFVGWYEEAFNSEFANPDSEDTQMKAWALLKKKCEEFDNQVGWRYHAFRDIFGCDVPESVKGFNNPYFAVVGKGTKAPQQSASSAILGSLKQALNLPDTATADDILSAAHKCCTVTAYVEATYPDLMQEIYSNTQGVA